MAIRKIITRSIEDGAIGAGDVAAGSITTAKIASSVTLTTPTIDTITSAAATALTLKSAGTTAITVDTSQKVGIGTASPSNQLDVQATTAKVGVTSTTGTNTTFYSANNTGGSFYFGLDNSAGTEFGTAYAGAIYRSGAYPITFYTAAAERMRIDSSGNVGIGAAATNEGGYSRCLQVTGTGGDPTAALEVKSGSSYSYLAQNGTTLQIRNNATSGAMTFSTASTERLRITGNGGISQNGDWGSNASTALRNASAAANKFWQSGPDSNNNYIIYNQAGTGAYIVDGGTSWQFVSDETVKENLVPIQDAIEKVATLRAVIGNYINDENKTKHPFLIAQDVQAVLPEATNTSPEGKLGMSYTDVIPLLVASIKELKAENDALKARLDAAGL